MSWHHEDYINLFSALGGVISAASAAYAAKLARDATRNSNQLREDSQVAQTTLHLREELKLLADLCNTFIGESSLVKYEFSAVAEIATAMTNARETLEFCALDVKEKEKLKAAFKRMIRPGIIAELSSCEVFYYVGAISIEMLRDEYRKAQQFLDVEDPKPIPEPTYI